MRALICHCGAGIHVEDFDFILVGHLKWYCSSRSLQCKHQGKSIAITHFIMYTPPPGKMWDHKDRNCHNNLHDNLRLVTNEQNLKNKNIYVNNVSGCRGVSWIQRDGVWRATVSSKGKKIYIGDFPTLELAKQARLQAEKEHYGIYAPSLK